MLLIQNKILAMIANGEALEATAKQICDSFEQAQPGVFYALLTVDRAGLLHPLAAPSLPGEFSAALDGVMIGPEVGACGTAAYHREPIMVEDIATDTRFRPLLPLLAGCGIASCWSFPIIIAGGVVAGVVSIYSNVRRLPDPLELSVAEGVVELYAMALRRTERIAERERRAEIDALTKLPNRSAFDAALANIPCDDPGSWALFVIDLDNLKIVNDTFGHLAGDGLIRIAAQRIARTMQPDATFRLGGDEFAVIIQSSKTLADLDMAAERIFNALGAPAVCHGHSIVPRATIGGAVLGAEDKKAVKVNEAADYALYHAKETGRGGFVRYWAGIGTRITHRRDAIRDVSEALAEGRIEAYYQPIVRLDTGQITGLEALCRMRTSDGLIVAAHAFQEATADARVAAALTQTMIEAVAHDIVHWQRQGLTAPHIGVNVSTADFYGSSLTQKISDAFGAVGAPLDHLVIEITEDVYIGRNDRVVAQEIASLRAAGMRVALDDFGTGYASLTHLLHVPVDVLKIDQTFVARLRPGDPSLIIVESLIDIARRLGIYVIAEGIESEAQALQLSAMGCKMGQGFAYSPAVDRQEAGNLLLLYARGPRGLQPKAKSDASASELGPEAPLRSGGHA